MDALGGRIAVIGLLVTAWDILYNGLDWRNGTDTVMGGTAFIPEVGWILGATYFIADLIVKHYIGKSISQEAGIQDCTIIIKIILCYFLIFCTITFPGFTQVMVE